MIVSPLDAASGDAAAAVPLAPMKLLRRVVYRGPHLYSATPMIRLELDLGALEERPTNTLPRFSARLLETLPGLVDHHCSHKAPGGLVRRLADGTWIGHVVEHVALELQVQAGHKATRGKTRSVKGRCGVYNVMYAYEDEDVALKAGDYALRLVSQLLPTELQALEGVDGSEQPLDLATAIADLKSMARRASFGPTTAALVAAARQRGIPVSRLNGQSLVRLGWGRRQQLIRASVTGRTSLIGAETASDKDFAKQLLIAAGIPVPRGEVVRSADAAVEVAARLRWPVVTKPLDGNHGRGVSLDLASEEQVRWGFEQAVRHSRRVLVEEQFKGRDFRVLVVGGEVVAVAERTPARVTGDGRRTVAQLIEAVNADPRRGDGHEAVMTRIKVDDHVREMLARAGLSLEDAPEAGRTVQLRATANLSTGGTAIDRTDEIHPDNASIARRAAAVVGLDVAGIDFVAPDISRSVRETGGGVVEVNAAPGLRMHLEPSIGRKRDVAGPVIDMLFPERRPGRIPVVGISGTNGKSTTVRMVNCILRHAGKTVGFTTTSGVYVGGERIFKGDASGPKSARMVLADPTVDVAVLETARGGIVREGLGFDRCDVGAVLNVAADHLGLGGVDTLEDLAAVKGIVTQSVSRRGVSVLNADDPMTLRLAKHAGGRIAWFTLRGGLDTPPLVQKHIAAGGMAALVEGDNLMLHDRGQAHLAARISSLPATLGGLAMFNVANAAAAALIGRALDVDLAVIRQALESFTSSFEDNPGRINIHDGHGFRVIVDYAHNPAGLHALGELIEKLRPRYARVIGSVSIPGDRRDEDIREMGVLAADLFDQVVFRERPDGRGREAGQVLDLMRQGALAAGMSTDQVECILDEAEAMAACLERARPGDLVILLPTDVERAWRQVQDFRPRGRPAGALQGLAPHA